VRRFAVVPLLLVACSSQTEDPPPPTSTTAQPIVAAQRMMKRDLDWVHGVKSGAITIRPRTLPLEGDALKTFCSIVKTTEAVIDTVHAIQDLRNQKATPKNESADELSALWPDTKVDGNDVVFLPDEGSGTTSGASQAAVLDDENAGLLSIGYSVAKAIGLDIDQMCAENDKSGFETDESKEWDLQCTPFEEGSCKAGLLCANNGGRPAFCCRPAATSGTKCWYGVPDTCPPGLVCSNTTNDVQGDWVCAAPETCR